MLLIIVILPTKHNFVNINRMDEKTMKDLPFLPMLLKP